MLGGAGVTEAEEEARQVRAPAVLQPSPVDPRISLAWALSDHDRRKPADAWAGLATYRDQVDARRISPAADVAADLVVDVVTALADQPDMIAADALRQLLGTALDEVLYDDPGGRIRPHDLARGLITAAQAAVRSTAGQEDAWRGPWRVIIAVADIPARLRGSAERIRGDTV